MQIVEAGQGLPAVPGGAPAGDLSEVSFASLWLPEDRSRRAAIAGVQPKVAYHSRSIVGGRAGFRPAVRGQLRDAVTRRHWLSFAADVGLPSKVTERLLGQVAAAVGQLADRFTEELLDMPPVWVRDVRRRVSRRVRALQD